MSSLLATATTAIMTALTGVPGIPTPMRITLRPLSSGTSVAVVVRPAQSEVAQTSASGQVVAWKSLIAIECYARATPGTTPDAAVDALVSAVYAAIAADLTLGGQVIEASPEQIVYDFDAEADQFVCAILALSILQTTPPGQF